MANRIVVVVSGGVVQSVYSDSPDSVSVEVFDFEECVKGLQPVDFF